MRRLKALAVCLAFALTTLLTSITSYAVTTPDIAAASAIVINASTGQVLYAKDAETSYYPASITKVMTAMLVLEHCSMDEVVTFQKQQLPILKAEP